MSNILIYSSVTTPVSCEQCDKHCLAFCWQQLNTRQKTFATTHTLQNNATQTPIPPARGHDGEGSYETLPPSVSSG